MNNIILFDDDKWRDLLPLCLTRPVAKLRIGIFTIAEKWEKHLNGQSSYITQDYLSEKYKIDISSDNYVINSRWLPNQKLVSLIRNLGMNDALLFDETLVAARMDNKQFNRLLDNTELNELKGIDISKNGADFTVINRPHHIFIQNGDEIRKDFELIDKSSAQLKLDKSVQVYGDYPVYIHPTAKLMHCTINSSDGPVYIGENAEVMEGSALRGPLAICNNTIIKMGAKVYKDSTFGPFCKIGGEVSNVVFIGYANKAHDGYLGNSVIGEWCNLGAGTNCSNLKNNYSEVKLWNYKSKRFEKTETQFCGLIMGDHSKCGIDVMFNTGTVVGVSANIYGSGYPRNYIPSYSWGGASNYKTFRIEEALDVANKVMERRGMELSQEDKLIMEHIFYSTSSYRSWES